MYWPFLSGVIIGMIIGGFLGVLIMWLMAVARDQWDEIDEEELDVLIAALQKLAKDEEVDDDPRIPPKPKADNTYITN